MHKSLAMMNPRYSELRAQLAQRLKAVLGKPQVESKELMAFDLLVNRRDFLKGAEKLAALTALVNTGLVPTAWGQVNPDMKVSPQQVGLTTTEQSSATKASQLGYGTELFQDSFYSQPVVSAEDAFGHGVIEGMRFRPKLQGSLSDTSPVENTFLDQGFHFGPNELIQLEQDSNNYPTLLVHYYHPQDARSDGKTDGLHRYVINDGSDGYPLKKILCVTGARTNQYSQGQNQLTSQASYLIFVEAEEWDNNKFFVGSNNVTLPSPYVEQQTDNIAWASYYLTDLPVSNTGWMFCDKYSDSGFQSGAYAPGAAYEHILLYYTDSVAILSLSDADPNQVNVMVTEVPYPDPGNVDENGWPLARITHISWDDVGAITPSQVVFSTNTQEAVTNANEGGYQNYCTCAITSSPHTGGTPQPLGTTSVYTNTIFTGDFVGPSTASASSNQISTFDYSAVKQVQSLFSYTSGGKTYHVKLANFGAPTSTSLGLVVFIIMETTQGSSQVFQLVAHYALSLPGSVSEILNLSGGVSKFGGYRFFSIDQAGHVFMNRQQRLDVGSTPYGPPIYCQYDTSGDLANFSDGTQWSVPPGNLQPELGKLESYLTTTLEESDPTVYNILLYTILGFSTDVTNASQGVCLGSVYKAVYARNRMAGDSVHIAVKPVDEAGTTMGAFNVFNTLLERTWHQRQIATQAPYSGLGYQQSGDFYQATVSPTNAYGQTVSLSDSQNQNLGIEVRADAPCMVTDEVSNFYYDIDRYTSFMAAVDPGTGRARLVVKADQLGMSLSVRLVRTDSLLPSGDLATLRNSSSTEYGWVTINMAEQSQQRMSNTSESTSTESVPDTTVYVTSASLTGTKNEFGWQTKGNYTTRDFDSVATFCNQSGQNLLAIQNTENSGATYNSDSDPLYKLTNLTADPSRTSLTTTFDYKNGTVSGTANTASAASAAQVGTFPSRQTLGGSAWHSVSHALHDSFHWLQHVEHEAYDDLNNGISIAIDDTASTLVTVGADIMKEANGVDQVLNEVVTTVEEYASVVTNVLMTIVEDTITFIEAIISLLSLFAHFGDIGKLSDSLYDKFTELIATPPQIPDYDVKADMAPTVGSSNTVSDSMDSLDLTSVTETLMENPFQEVMNSPFANKLMQAVVSAMNQTSPLSFSMNQNDALDTILTDIQDLLSDFTTLVEDVASDTIETFISNIYADIDNPQKTYANLSSSLGPLMAEFESDAMSDIYPFFQKFTHLANSSASTVPTGSYDVSFIQDMFSNKLLTLKIPGLADLFKLFGIGDVHGNDLEVKGKDAVFFPMALVVWTTYFIMHGKSIKDVCELDSSCATTVALTQQSTLTMWSLSSAIVSTVFYEIDSLLWVAVKAEEVGEDYETFVGRLDAFMNLIPGTMSLLTNLVTIESDGEVEDPADLIHLILQDTIYIANLYIAFQDEWEDKDIPDLPDAIEGGLKLILMLVTLLAMIYDIVAASEDGEWNSNDGRLDIIGGDVLSNVGYYLDFFYWLADHPEGTLKDSLEVWGITMVSVPITGNILEIASIADQM